MSQLTQTAIAPTLPQSLRVQFATRRNFNCVFHPKHKAVVVVAAHDLTTRSNALRPLCAACLDQVRNTLAALAGENNGRALT